MEQKIVTGEIYLTEEQLSQLGHIEKLVNESCESGKFGMVVGQLFFHNVEDNIYNRRGQLRLAFLPNEIAQDIVDITASVSENLDAIW